MGKKKRVSEQERIRRAGQRKSAQFDHWRKKNGQPDTSEAAMLYRLIGQKRKPA